jgi:hypothetical protein
LLADLGSPAANTNQTYTTPSSLLPGTPYSFVLLAIGDGQQSKGGVFDRRGGRVGGDPDLRQAWPATPINSPVVIDR